MKLREALCALAHPELGAPTKTMELLETMELMLLLVELMELLLEPLELVKPLELTERKSVLLLKKYLCEKRLRPRRLLQPMPRGRVLRLRLRLRLAALWREAAACAIGPTFALLLTTVGGALAMVEQVLKEQLMKVMLALRPRCCCEVLLGFWLASSCRALRALREHCEERCEPCE